MKLRPYPPKASKTKIVEFDLPAGTIVWSRWPQLGYNEEMEQKNRIRINPDSKGGYSLVFLRITWENGVEKEEEVERLYFTNKVDFEQFRTVTIKKLNSIK